MAAARLAVETTEVRVTQLRRVRWLAAMQVATFAGGHRPVHPDFGLSRRPRCLGGRQEGSGEEMNTGIELGNLGK